MLFNDLNVLITGASSGLGEAFARALSQKKANLILTARSIEKLKNLKCELETKDHTRVHIFNVDLSSDRGAKDLSDMIFSSGLNVDLLINNAGFGTQKEFHIGDIDVYAEMIQVNIGSMVSLTRSVLPAMLQRGRGGIINISSTAAFQPIPYFALYAASKSFVLYFSEALSGEYQDKGIKVLTVCPGHTRTNFHQRAGVDPKRLFNTVSAEKVVNEALDAYVNGKTTIVPGFLNHFLSNLNRLLPRKSVIKITKKFFQP